MKKVIAACCFCIVSQCFAGLFVSAGAGLDQIKERFQKKTEQEAAGNPHHKSLNALVGLGFAFEPSDSFMLPVSFEASYSNFKSYVKHAVVSDSKSLAGAIMARPTYNMGWVGLYGAVGYLHHDLSSLFKKEISKTTLQDEFNELVYGAGLTLKLDRSIHFYLEYIPNLNRATGQYESQVEGEKQRAQVGAQFI